MSNLALKGCLAALSIVVLAAIGVGMTQGGHSGGDAVRASSPRDATACARATTAFTVLAQPPLRAPFQSICSTAEFGRLVNEWGEDNLTIAMNGAAGGVGVNATGGGAGPGDATAPARFTIAWVATCDPSIGQTGPCYYSEWWTADLERGTVSGPFASGGAPWHPPEGTARIIGTQDPR